ncbi:MAG TPA: DNA polymerase domain-containing protein [Candidatus Acidoferrales bacterium]|nr:DNA polymerase domain-containing protein [Candidatus Acidoferrales bacterium]
MDPSLLIAARKRRRAIGYLGFKNARFGRIDAHIATCAFSRQILKQAVALAESKGFRLVHGIVDSMWLKKPGATTAEYKDLCHEIETRLHFPIEFEGFYKWIVFLNSRRDPRIPVLNRYYGALQDGRLKQRGVDLRKHDTPKIVRRCQIDMLNLLAQANNAEEFKALIPKTLNLAKSYTNLIRSRSVALEELTIEKRLSKNPDEYQNIIPQAIAARHLAEEGMEIHAGQTIEYILTQYDSRIPQNRAIPIELIQEDSYFDSKRYVDLILSATANLLSPFKQSNVIQELLH